MLFRSLLFPLTLLALGPAFTPSGRINLSWSYPTNEFDTNLVFRVYSSTNATDFLTNWSVLTNVVGTNLSATVTIAPGARFFFMTASNFWGESNPSEVASTPALPRSDSRIGITRGD